ncbi:MAG: hypothetical protein A2161_11930 [Candidatus Schekmanbacteria bacterium RBG_13_48_7]|uniref:Haem-binding domain-containing protein n=1 Tax=Candidatus Schekmanbacteria bacterium RBG_13_48_7 TaxID=1817878 RepID=A0A1F7S2H1_9BACT|nr:MAG: hypothetical protein A2161_11930 [Candidatus Schekmanbacteria bacterium RBG_13_48_7]
MKKSLIYVLIGLVLILLAIQLIMVNRDNPEVNRDIEIKTPPEIAGILKTSCYDCHSNETKWPFYSYIAPISWFVAHDVHEGRDAMNFSEWEKLSPIEQNTEKKRIVFKLEKGKMPPADYLFIHRDVRLFNQQIELVKKWVETGS